MAKRRAVPLELETWEPAAGGPAAEPVPAPAAAAVPAPGTEPAPATGAPPAEPAGGTATRRRRSRGRAAAILVAAGLVLWVAFPLRTSRATNDLRSLSRAWSTAAAVDAERDVLVSRIGGLDEGSEPEATIAAAYSALDLEEAGVLTGIRARLAGRWSFTGSVETLRRAMGTALTSEVAGLRAAAAAGNAPIRSAATITLVARVDDLLTAGLAAASVARVRVTDPPILHAGDHLLALLAHQSDRPVPLSLLEFTGQALVVADLRTGRSTPAARLPIAPSTMIAGSGFDVLTDDSNGVVVLPDARGARPILVPQGYLAVAAARRDRFWVTAGNGDVSELDGRSRTLAGPLRLPQGGHLAGEVPAGLVVGTADAAGLEVVDRAAAHPVEVISTDPQAEVLDVEGAVVAWTVAQPGGGPAPLYLTDTATGRATRAATPVLASYGPGQLSPRGDRFAGFFTSGAAGNVGQLGVVDVATGTCHRENLVGTPSALTWSPDGRWLLAVTTRGGAVALDTVTGSATPVRFPAGSGPFSVLP